MSDLVFIAFPSEQAAQKVRDKLLALQVAPGSSLTPTLRRVRILESEGYIQG